MRFISNIGFSLSLYRKDKVILLLSMVPVLIGMLLYSTLGAWIYGDVLSSGKEWVEMTISSGTTGVVLSYILVGLLTIALYFIVSWTFVLAVSLLAAPFSDLISSRVEKHILGKTQDSLQKSFRKVIIRYSKVFFNEVKKLSFILLVSLFSFGLSFIPFLVPVTMLISALLLATEFLDYNWCRNELNFRECMKDIKGSFLTYSLGGGLILILITIPIVNLFVFPFGVVYFSALFVRNRRYKEIS